MSKTGTSIAAAVALMLSAATTAGCTAEEDELVKCEGINDCQGLSECAGADNDCQGLNECEGMGFLTVTETECEDEGGTVIS